MRITTWPNAASALVIAVLCMTRTSMADCPEDLTGDGSVGGADLGTMLSAWGPCDDPDDCPEDLTDDGNVGGADLGTLLSAWGPCPADICPPDAIDEGESCGDETTDGCNMDQPAFGPSLTCGESVCGSAWAEDGTRDTDWYPFTVDDEPTQVTWSVEAQFDAIVLIIDANEGCIDSPSVLAGDAGPNASAEACLAPGDYWLFVSVDGFDDHPCSAEQNDYVATVESCVVDPEVCDIDEPSNCCEPKPGQAGCEDAACEAAVCDQDPFCCDLTWNQSCAKLANELCEDLCDPAPCAVDCPSGGTDEDEACGDSTNDGCNADDPEFGSISCDETICGTAWAENGLRDTDWFMFEVTETASYSAELVSNFPGIVAFLAVDPDDPNNCFQFVGEFGHSDAECGLGTATGTLEPGLYAVFVAHGTKGGGGIFHGYPCDSGASDYTVTLDCE